MSYGLIYVVQLPSQDILYLQAIVEGYEGVMTMTTPEPDEGIATIFTTSDFKDEVEIILKDLENILNLKILEVHDDRKGNFENLIGIKG